MFSRILSRLNNNNSLSPNRDNTANACDMPRQYIQINNMTWPLYYVKKNIWFSEKYYQNNVSKIVKFFADPVQGFDLLNLACIPRKTCFDTSGVANTNYTLWFMDQVVIRVVISKFIFRTRYLIICKLSL